MDTKSQNPAITQDDWENLKKRLTKLGMSKWGFLKSETRALAQLLHKNEHIGGVIFGHSKPGSIMLVATDRRGIYLDTKPLFMKSEEISYDVVAGITLEWVGYRGTVVLHTRLGDFSISTLNKKAALIFRKYVEYRCIEHHKEEAKNAKPLKQ